MKLLWPIAFAILITACETGPPPLDLSTFEEFKTVEAEATYPDALPKLNELECYPDENSCRIAGYNSTADVDKLEAYKIVSEGNTAIAQANAEAVDSALAQSAELVAAGIAAEKISEIREEQLRIERQLRQQEKWYYRAMLALAGVAIVLTAD